MQHKAGFRTAIRANCRQRVANRVLVLLHVLRDCIVELRQVSASAGGHRRSRSSRSNRPCSSILAWSTTCGHCTSVLLLRDMPWLRWTESWAVFKPIVRKSRCKSTAQPLNDAVAARMFRTGMRGLPITLAYLLVA